MRRRARSKQFERAHDRTTLVDGTSSCKRAIAFVCQLWLFRTLQVVIPSRSIGIDDGSTAPYLPGMHDAAAAFCALFPEVYVRFCRRHDRNDTRLTTQMDAVLQHLAMSGPLTIGEMARHFARAQSVVSDIVSGLEKKSLLERMPDERDRRRTLVWLTDEARDVMARKNQVLDPARVARAMKSLGESERRGLVGGMRALLRATGVDPHERER
jgi:DNA-binding MarR family transcriptional regulator